MIKEQIERGDSINKLNRKKKSILHISNIDIIRITTTKIILKKDHGILGC